MMLSSAKLGCLFSVGLAILSSPPTSFLLLLVIFLPQEPYLDLPRITGRDLQEVARVKKSPAGGLDGWAWNELKALPLTGSLVWLFSLNWLRPLVSGHRVFWMLVLP